MRRIEELGEYISHGLRGILGIVIGSLPHGEAGEDWQDRTG
jgi:hypothetical protein